MKSFAIATLVAATIAISASAKAEPVLSYWGGYIPQAYVLTHWGTWVPACDTENLTQNVCQDETPIMIKKSAPKPAVAS